MHPVELVQQYEESSSVIQVPDMADVLAYLDGQPGDDVIDLWDSYDCLGARLLKAVNPGLDLGVSWGAVGGDVHLPTLPRGVSVYVSLARGEMLYEFIRWLFYDHSGLSTQLRTLNLAYAPLDVTVRDLALLAHAYHEGGSTAAATVLAAYIGRVLATSETDSAASDDAHATPASLTSREIITT